MRWTCLLALVSVACFSESDTVPPQDGGEGTTEGTAPGSTSSPTATRGVDGAAESTTLGGGQSAGSEAGSTAAAPGTDAGSTTASATTGGEDGTTATPAETGSTSAAATCSCGWDPTFEPGDGSFGAYACSTALAGTMAPGNDPPMACPRGFTAGSLCEGQPVGLAGCCDADGNVAFCLGGGPAGGIDCADEVPPQSCND